MERITVAILQEVLPVCGIHGRPLLEDGFILSTDATQTTEA
jgi:hypothetical protein